MQYDGIVKYRYEQLDCYLLFKKNSHQYESMELVSAMDDGKETFHLLNAEDVNKIEDAAMVQHQ